MTTEGDPPVKRRDWGFRFGFAITVLVLVVAIFFFARWVVSLVW